MDTVIIACKTLENELLCAKHKATVSYPILWIESGLHNTPKKLKQRLQETLDNITAQRVLMAFGFCGNSMEGITACDFQLIVPRVDDCISLLLGSVEERTKTSHAYAAYFLTEGWMRGERNPWVEHQYAVEKYGEEQAMAIADMMYVHYRTLGLLDSGTYPIGSLLDSTKIISDTLRLEQKVIPASVDYLVELLTGPWPKERFLVKDPGERIVFGDLCFL